MPEFVKDMLVGGAGGFALGMLWMILAMNRYDKKANAYINSLKEAHRAEVYELERRLGKWQ